MIAAAAHHALNWPQAVVIVAAIAAFAYLMAKWS